MIDLGESKKVTAVLKLFFFKCLELPRVIIFINNFYNPEYIEHKISWYLSVILTVTSHF